MSQFNDENETRLEPIRIDDGPTLHTTKYETKVPTLHKCYLFFYSFLVAILSVANPLLEHVANPLQSQNLYIGMMLTKGQIPYSEVFSTGGMLYFAMIAFSYLLKSTWWIVLFEMIAFYVSGIYLYKLINFFTGIQKVAWAFSFLFYFLMGTLGFGGIYPIQFALPFVLISLWFLTKYFAALIKDEAFILFGLAGAMAMLLEPRALIFWLVSSIVIIVYNSKQHHVARGFYQLLASILGMLLVFYTAGYFILNLQILGPYLAQAVRYQFTFFKVGTLSVLLSVLVQVIFAFGLGISYGVIAYLKHFKETNHRYIKWIMVFVSLVQFVVIILSSDFALYHFLPLLPFALILISLPVAEEFSKRMTISSHRRGKKKQNGMRQVIGLYFSKAFYLPLLIVGISLFQSMTYYFKDAEQSHSRSKIVSYIKSHTESSDRIYVWDNSSAIYTQSIRKSASQFASPGVNFKNPKHQKILADELLQNRAQLIVVNQKIAMPKVIQKALKKNYKLVRKASETSFQVYQQK